MTSLKLGGVLLCTLGGMSCHCGSEQHAPSSGDEPVVRVRSGGGTALGSVRHRSAMLELLSTARRGGKTKVEHRVPSEEDAESYARWVVSALQSSGDVPARPGFVTRAVGDDGGLVALMEEPRQKRGMGAVFLRRGSTRPTLVEIPHSFFDVGTLEIGIALFELLEARVLMVNTVHRYRSTDGDKPSKGEHSTSDMAHAPRSSYLSLHEALITHQPKLLTIQVHGFADAAAEGVDVIVSGSKTSLDPRPVAERLRKSLPGVQVRAYPYEIDQLGGTTNVEARASNRRGSEFLHIELSSSMRKRLSADDAQEARRALAHALLPLRSAVDAESEGREK